MANRPSRMLLWFRPMVHHALEALRRDWKGVAVVAMVGAAAVALVVSSRGLLSAGSANLSLPSIASLGAIVHWTRVAVPPDAARYAATTDLLLLLQATAWAAFAVSFLSILCRYLAHSAERGRELAIRRAVGATRNQSIGTLLLEGALVSSLLWVAAVGGAATLLAWHGASWPGSASSLHASWRLPALLALVLVMLAVLAPLSYASSRFLARPPEERSGLKIPVLQLAVSFAVLITGAMLSLQAGQLGLAKAARGPATATIVQFESGITDPAVRSTRYAELTQRLRRTPGVAMASLSGPGSLLALGTEDFTMSDCGQCVRGGIILAYPQFRATYRVVATETLTEQARLDQGRLFADSDQWDTARVAIVNRHLAGRYFEGGDAVGRLIYLGANDRRLPHRVVGVVSDTPSQALGGGSQSREAIYLPVSQHPPASAELTVRSAAPAFSMTTAEALLRDTLGKGARITSMSSERAILHRESTVVKWFAQRFGIAGAVIFLVAVVGTFDAMRMWIRGMTHELAIRRALGASRRRIAAWVMWRATGASISAAALGWLLYLVVVAPEIAKLLRDVPVWDTEVVVAACTLLTAAALTGVIVPLRRVLGAPPAAGLG